VSVEHDAVSSRGVTGEPRFPRIALTRVNGICVTRGIFLTGYATDEPSIAAKQFVQAIEQTYLVCVHRPPSAYEGAAVHTCDHGQIT
jgi:hypothetical protein